MKWSRRSIMSFVAATNNEGSGYYGRNHCFGSRLSSKTKSFSLEFPYFTYMFENQPGRDTVNSPINVYVPFTSYCNSKTLPELRGPNFRLPPGVAATLCRVRDFELKQERWKFWCTWLDSVESYQQLPIPSEDSKVVAIAENQNDSVEHRPTVEELIEELQWRLDKTSSSAKTTTVVVAGEGEPTLRLGALIQFIERLRQLNHCEQKLIRLRIMTNGLLCDKKTQHLLNVCCGNTVLPIEFSVALMTHDSKQYNNLMDPLVSSFTDGVHVESELPPFFIVQKFIEAVVARQATHQGTLKIEVTAVERPDVNINRTNQLAASLGVTAPIRWRPYFE